MRRAILAVTATMAMVSLAMASLSGKTTVAATPASETASARNRAELLKNVRIVKDVQYCTGGSLPLLMDFYLPRSQSDKLAPAILWLHGGGWRIGSKEEGPLTAELASQGFVVASANYRLSGDAPFPAAVEDAKCAIRFLRANAAKYGIDPKRIGVAGSSAGGHLALLLATAHESAGLEGSGGWADVSSRVSAVLSWFGPTDFGVGPAAFESGTGFSIRIFLGGDPKRKPDNYKKASPVNWVSRDDPPLLLIHGNKDVVVPFDQSARMANAYRKLGLNVRLIKVRNAGHNFQRTGSGPISPPIEKIKRISVEFFQNALNPPGKN